MSFAAMQASSWRPDGAHGEEADASHADDQVGRAHQQQRGPVGGRPVRLPQAGRPLRCGQRGSPARRPCLLAAVLHLLHAPRRGPPRQLPLPLRRGVQAYTLVSSAAVSNVHSSCRVNLASRCQGWPQAVMEPQVLTPVAEMPAGRRAAACRGLQSRRAACASSWPASPPRLQPSGNG